MTQQRAVLAFKAKLMGVKVNIPKSEYYGSPSGGSTDITLRIEGPAAPRPPQKSWPIVDPRPAEPKKKRGEAEPTFEKRKADWEKDCNKWDQGIDRYNQQVAEYNKALESFHSIVVAYAQVVGWGSLLGGREVQISLELTETGFLPGLFEPFSPMAPIAIAGAQVTQEGVEESNAGGEDDYAENLKE